MSIAKRVQEAMDKMLEGDAEGALIPISIAVDATAGQEYPGMAVGEAYKRFLHDRFPLIMKVASGGRVSGQTVRLEYNHPEVKPGPDGCCSMEQILYRAVRCGLVHNARLPSNLKFRTEGIINIDDGSLVLPASFVSGLIAAVVVSPANKNQSLSSAYGFNVRGRKKILLNDLWGKGAELSDVELLEVFETAMST